MQDFVREVNVNYLLMIILDPMQEDNLSQQNRGSESLPWPAPISRDMKEALLQKFLEQMSMSALEEATCAVCNVRVPVRKSKKLPVSKISNSHLLQVSEELEDLLKKENQGKTQYWWCEYSRDILNSFRSFDLEHRLSISYLWRWRSAICECPIQTEKIEYVYALSYVSWSFIEREYS